MTLGRTQTITGDKTFSGALIGADIMGVTSVTGASIVAGLFSVTEGGFYIYGTGGVNLATINPGAMAGDITLTLPATTGTLALTSQITGTNSGTNTGDQASIVGITGTKAQFQTAMTDDDFVTLAGTQVITGLKSFSPATGSGISITSTNGTGAGIISDSGIGASITSYSNIGANITSTDGTGAAIFSANGPHLNIGADQIIVANSGALTSTAAITGTTITGTAIVGGTVAGTTGTFSSTVAIGGGTAITTSGATGAALVAASTVTAANTALGVTRIVAASTDVRTANSYTNDAELSISGITTGVYMLEGFIRFTNVTGANWTWRLLGTSLVISETSSDVIGYRTTGSNLTTQTPSASSPFTTGAEALTVASGYLYFNVMITVTTGGSLAISSKNNTGVGTGTRLAGSYLQLTKL